MSKVKIKTVVEVEEEELLEAVFGSGCFAFPWWVNYHSTSDPGVMDVEVYLDPDNPDESDTIKCLVTASLLAHQAGRAIEKGKVDGCTGRPITAEWDQWDACEADTILQMACFGDELFS